jgi:hypothetical protein
LIERATEQEARLIEASQLSRQTIERAALINSMPKSWSIGIYIGESPSHLLPAAGLNNPVLSRSDVSDVPASFLADPFMIRAGDLWHMFFEVKNILTGKGEIGLAQSLDGFAWRYRQIVLAEAFHLSYPYVFACEGEYYMIPETLQANQIRLYKAVSFPTAWTPVADLVEGQFADPSIFRLNGRWWLFACSRPFQHDALRLYSADSLFGPWAEHPQSPIIESDPRTARPAGRVVKSHESVIRYAQDCYPKYGTQVRAFEICELTRTTYQERESDESPVLTPGKSGWNGMGMHHIDAHLNSDGKWIACVDGRFLP